MKLDQPDKLHYCATQRVWNLSGFRPAGRGHPTSIPKPKFVSDPSFDHDPDPNPDPDAARTWPASRSAWRWAGPNQGGTAMTQSTAGWPSVAASVMRRAYCKMLACAQEPDGSSRCGAKLPETASSVAAYELADQLAYEQGLCRTTESSSHMHSH